MPESRFVRARYWVCRVQTLCMNTLDRGIARFDRKLPDGIYKGVVKPVIEKAELISVCRWLNQVIDHRIPDNANKRQWPSELWSFISLGTGIILLLLADHFRNDIPNWLSWLAVITALYSPLDIFIFGLNWVFVHQASVHSYKRSLAGFGLNFVTVVVCFAAAFLWGKCIKEPTGGLTALYSSMRIAVTIGPIETQDAVVHWQCRSLIIGEVVVAYFLAITVIAYLVGAVRRNAKE